MTALRASIAAALVALANKLLPSDRQPYGGGGPGPFIRK